MTRILATRLAQIALTLAILSFCAFALIALMPGDPIEVTLAPSATGTMLALVQSTEGFDAEGVAALAAGYGAFFDPLDRVLASEENA